MSSMSGPLLPLPDGYYDLVRVRSTTDTGTDVNVMGVVVDFLPPKQTGGTGASVS